jgi:MFS family permease
MYAVSEGPGQGWATVPVIGGAACGAVLLAAMIAVELRKASPVVDVRLLTNRLFASGTTVMAVESAAFLGTVYTMTLYLQDERGFSPLAAGLSTFPQAVGIVMGSQLASRLLYRRLGPRRHLLLGVGGTSATVALMSLLGSGTSLWWVSLLLFVMGLAVGQVFVGTQSASFATVSASASGRASTLFNVGRRLGGALGVAVATTVLVSATGGVTGSGRPPDLMAYRAAFLTAAALNLLGLYASRRVSDAEAASTIPARRPRGGSAIRLRRSDRPGRALPPRPPLSDASLTEKVKERQT